MHETMTNCKEGNGRGEASTPRCVCVYVCVASRERGGAREAWVRCAFLGPVDLGDHDFCGTDVRQEDKYAKAGEPLRHNVAGSNLSEASLHWLWPRVVIVGVARRAGNAMVGRVCVCYVEKAILPFVDLPRFAKDRSRSSMHPGNKPISLLHSCLGLPSRDVVVLRLDGVALIVLFRRFVLGMDTHTEPMEGGGCGYHSIPTTEPS